MTYTDFYADIKKAVIAAEQADGYNFVGVRFEDKLRAVGDVCECSKHNPDREDERDFPDYGTPEYDDMPELGGTSAWLVYNAEGDWAEDFDASKIYALEKPSYIKDDNYRGNTKHAYVIASNYTANHSDRDHGEIVLVDAVVLAVIF